MNMGNRRFYPVTNSIKGFVYRLTDTCETLLRVSEDCLIIMNR